MKPNHDCGLSSMEKTYARFLTIACWALNWALSLSPLASSTTTTNAVTATAATAAKVINVDDDDDGASTLSDPHLSHSPVGIYQSIVNEALIKEGNDAFAVGFSTAADQL
jgi:hypothetical protein